MSTNPLQAAYYADHAVSCQTEIVDNERLARDTYRVRLHCPDLARSIVPGQFVMLKLAGFDDPLLGRPLALYDTVLDADGEPVGIDLVYLVAGKLTRKLAESQAGQMIDLWGPLGNGFSGQSAEHLIFVAGGIGQTPFVALAAEALGLKSYGDATRRPCSAGKVTLCYGARSADYLAGLSDFKRLGIEVRTSTDDGSAGHHGLVTEVLREVLADSGGNPRIICCGPERMMEAVAQIASEEKVACEVSLETPMACGIGICFSCVAKVRQDDGGWDYKRTCVEGPVFEAGKIVW